MFRVVARAPAMPGSPQWTSPPVSGHSVDNLLPFPPASLASTAEPAGTLLSWAPVGAPDLAGYRVYRLAIAGAPLTEANLLATIAATQFLDEQAPSCEYAVVAVDVHGNQSAPARLAVTTLNGPLRGDAFSFAPPTPNPARDAALLTFTLPAPGAVRIEVFDPSGRRVRDLSPGLLGAGMHRVGWDLRDAEGRTLRPGLYLVRLSAAARTQFQRLAIVR
jgi:hypothetical protein